MNQPIRLAYLVSRYPAISHTFILREITTLRTLGFDIQVASINHIDRPIAQLTAQEREEMSNTFYVKSAGIWGALTAHTKTFFTQPLNYLKGLWFAIRLGGTNLKKIIYSIFYFVEAVMIGQWMKKHQMNHLHVHFGMAAATVGMITSRIFPIEFSLTIHGPDEFYDVYQNHLPQKIVYAKFICCISHFARSQLMMLSSPTYWNKLEISPLGVDPEVFSRAVPYVPQPHVFQILCVGRLVPVKGQFVLLQAVEQLIAQGRRVQVYFVGDGPDRKYLENRVRKSNLQQYVAFAGAVNQDRILQFYRQADAFVLASFAEGVPVVLMEAMAMQIPCVTTHITGIPELIRTGDGLLVAPSDIEGLTQAILQLMDDPQLCREIGVAARNSVIQRYHLQENTRRLANIFTTRLSHLTD
jgi:colanic acid/amylovoran biosynthesis glycosyltransferase